MSNFMEYKMGHFCQQSLKGISFGIMIIIMCHIIINKTNSDY
jgi:hypothetical protein